ncbi:MAG: hypothetical protein EOP45_04690 [Sphingobacteriaceae bacterium]|nr:MAG: hypothetical protein EOP45_04690 [Sphingobacteriaceae bacterium]
MRNKYQIFIPFFLLIGLPLSAFCQNLIIPPATVLPKDSLVSSSLVSSLKGLLAGKEGPASQNEFVLKELLLETSALLDEMKGMEQNTKLQDQNFYKCYLGNVVGLSDKDFLIQLNYMGTNEGAPILKASFRLLTKRQGGRFYFYSPLKQNTSTWKTRLINHTTYHFKDKLDLNDVKEYEKTEAIYDKKLNAPVSSTQFYYCDDFPQALALLGIDSKLDYNGMKNNNLTASENHQSLVLNGWTSNQYKFDPHDLWHDRLRTVLASDAINRPVDEGCAYLYGGSWGISWPVVLQSFKAYATAHPDADWKNLYETSVNYTSGDKPLKVPYAINALIVRAIEKEKGFAPVMILLSCGKREKGDANYFAALKKVTGVTSAEFNSYVWELIGHKD